MNAVAPVRDRRRWLAVPPVGYALLVTIYILVRYGLRWGDSDTGQILQATRNVATQGTISPSGVTYPHGYAYQSIIVAVSQITGISISRVDLAVLPFLCAVCALVAFITFRLLTGSALLGSIAGILLFIQPEFVFEIERGSHEKTTNSYVLLLVFLITVTFARSVRTSSIIGYIVSFYILAWGLIATNSFFGSSFFVSLALALIGGAFVLWLSMRPDEQRVTINRLIYTVISGTALVFVFVNYVYSPARNNYGTLHSLIDRISALFLSFDVQSNPYVSIGSATGAAWVAPWVYPLLTSFDILIAIAGLAAWCWLAYRFVRGGIRREGRHLLLLWLFAAAFAFEVAISAIVDLSGFLGSNLQIRIFPLFVLFAIPLFVLAGAELATRLNAHLRVLAGVAVGLLITVFAVTGILKATNDPLVSNKWVFYTRDEQRALSWTDRDLTNQAIWAGFDERLAVMQTIENTVDPAKQNRYVVGSATDGARYFVDSNVTQRRGRRLKLPVPDTTDDDRIYDNGGTRIYHVVPSTPYQP
jgi:hypothetical protein